MNSVMADGRRTVLSTATRDSAVVEIGMLSSSGPRRENQDAVGARVPGAAVLARKGIAFAIADGVSASEAGRVAAETCVQNFLGDYFATPDAWRVKRSGGAVLNALNRWLLGQGARIRDTQRGYVTTFTGCVLHGAQLHVFHVGDTRLYRWRDGVLDPLTRDHRVQLDDGRPVLSRAMGLDYCVDIDYVAHDVRVGDVFLLLTDGVHDVLSPAAIASCLAGSNRPASAHAVTAPLSLPGELHSPDAVRIAQQTCESLHAAVHAAGAIDNISAVCVRVLTQPEPSDDDLLRAWENLPLLPVLDAGQRIDGLVVESVLAESPRSQVYRVRDESSNALRILKSPSPRCEDIDAVRREYMTEHWVLRRVQHPRLPRGAEPPKPRTALYVLTEPVAGQSLRQWLQTHRQAPVTDALQIARQIAVALRALHRRDILHRDVRPENILVDGNGQVTLIDLGQCRVAGLAETHGDGVLPGAREYAAPECFLGNSNEHSDQFSLAALLYEMLTGVLPYGNEGLADAKKGAAKGGGVILRLTNRHESKKGAESFFSSKKMTTPPFSRSVKLQPASARNPMVPAWLDAALARALSPDPAKRYGDIAEFSDALTRTVNRGNDIPVKESLLARDPVAFWKLTAAALALGHLIWLLTAMF